MKELEELQRAQRSAEAMEETLKNKYLAIKAANEQGLNVILRVTQSLYRRGKEFKGNRRTEPIEGS